MEPQPPPPGPGGDEFWGAFPAPCVPGRPPPPLPGVPPFSATPLSAGPGPFDDRALENGFAGLHSWHARVHVASSEWSATTLLRAEAPLRTVPGPPPALLAEPGLVVTAVAVPPDSLPDAPPGTPLLSRLRMLHRRVLPAFAARPAGASWQRLDGHDAVLDLLCQPSGGPVTGFSLAAEVGAAGGLVVVAAAPPDREATLGRVALPLASLAAGTAGALRWAALPGWALREEVQLTMPSTAATVRLAPLPDPAWGLAEWTDDVFARAGFLRDLRMHADRPVHVRGVTEARLRRFDWQPMGGGRLLTTVVTGVAAGEGFSLVADVPFAGEDLLLDVDTLLQMVEVRPALPPRPMAAPEGPSPEWPAPLPAQAFPVPSQVPASGRPAPTGPVPLPTTGPVLLPSTELPPAELPPLLPVERLIRAQIPPGWLVKESVTLLAPDGQANVIVSREPLDPTLTTQRYAEVQGELLRREFPQYSEDGLDPVPSAGGTALLRRFSWTPPDGVRVHQHQLYLVHHPGIGFTATATTPTSSIGRFADVFEQVLRSLQFDAPTREAAREVAREVAWEPSRTSLGTTRTYGGGGHGEDAWEASPDEPDRVAAWAEARLRREAAEGDTVEQLEPRSWVRRRMTPGGVVVSGVTVHDLWTGLPAGVPAPVPAGSRSVLRWSTGTFGAPPAPPPPPSTPPPRRRWGRR